MVSIGKHEKRWEGNIMKTKKYFRFNVYSLENVRGNYGQFVAKKGELLASNMTERNIQYLIKTKYWTIVEGHGVSTYIPLLNLKITKINVTETSEEVNYL